MNPLYFLSTFVILIKWHHCYLLWPNDGESQSTFDYDNEQDYDNNNESSNIRHFDKRSISTVESTGSIDDANIRFYNVGVLMASHLDSPFDLERCGPAVDLALERVNQEFLKSHRIRLKKVQGR